MTRRPFGVTADGHTVEAILLTWPGGLEVEVLTFGGVLRCMRFPGASGSRNAVLAYDALEDYERDTAYIGALVGRVANRIARGRFPLDGREVQVDVNEPPNTLHGGRRGFNKRIWRVAAADQRSVALAYTSADGEEGFPGELEVRATFRLISSDTLEISYRASADRPTVVNLTHHLYFNLAQAGATVLDHRLTMAAERFTPVGPGMVPTGEIAEVKGRPFDFRTGRTIGEALQGRDDQLDLAGGLDLNFTLAGEGEPALRLEGADGATLELDTDQVAVQVYDGHKLEAPFIRHGALAIEPQGFPDAPNHPAFPSVILSPGESYHRTSRYRLRA